MQRERGAHREEEGEESSPRAVDSGLCGGTGAAVEGVDALLVLLSGSRCSLVRCRTRGRRAGRPGLGRARSPHLEPVKLLPRPRSPHTGSAIVQGLALHVTDSLGSRRLATVPRARWPWTQPKLPLVPLAPSALDHPRRTLPATAIRQPVSVARRRRTSGAIPAVVRRRRRRGRGARCRRRSCREERQRRRRGVHREAERHEDEELRAGGRAGVSMRRARRGGAEQEEDAPWS